MAVLGNPARNLEPSRSGARLRLWLLALRGRFEEGSLARWQALMLPAAAVLLFAVVVGFSGARQMWHDELYTFYIAKAPSVTQMFREIPLDLNPPLEYLVARASMSLFGSNEYAIRLPSMLAFFVASASLYWFLARRISSVYGVLAVAVLWTTPFLYYATEARPYALVLAFFGIAMLAWTYRCEGRRPKTALVVLAFCICGMMLTHFFAVFYILPLCLAELLRDYRARKIDLPVWAVLLVPVAIPFVYLSMMARYEATAFPHVYLATWGTILEFFYNTLSPESWVLLPVICFAVFLAFRSGRTTDEAVVPSRVEVALIVGTLAIPFVIIAALIVTHGSFNNRYAIPIGFAYGIVLAFFTAIYTGASRLAATVASCLLFAYIALTNVLHPALVALHHFRTSGAQIQAAFVSKVEPGLPLVAASGLTFLEMDKYAKPATVSRLYYLTDREFALRYAHATIFGSLPRLKRVFPIRGTVAPYPQFVSEHRRFLVLGTPEYPEDWLIPRLLDIHASLRYLGDFPGPYKDHQLYEVTMPEDMPAATSTRNARIQK